MTNCELVTLAAKAAGINLHVWGTKGAENFADLDAGPFGKLWNPLKDDSDAFRLVVKLGLFVDAYAPATTVGNVICSTSLACKTRMEDHNGDAYAATRRAIVRAAAEIGKAMP